MKSFFSKDINEKSIRKNIENDSVKNLKSKGILKTFSIANSTVNVEIKGAMFGTIDEKEIVLDEVMVNERVKNILTSLEKTSSKYNPMPKKVVIYNNDDESSADSEMENNKEKNSEDTLVNLYEPNWSLDEVYISNEDKETILTSLSMAKYKDILFNKWGIKGNKDNGRALCLNFWGAPGTGKSITAEAIANNLEKKLLIVNYSELESKYVGETPKNIKRIFKIAKENDAVIVFDEADSFLGKRLTNVTQSADYGVNITRSVMLIELENFDGVVIFTTNLLTNYDDAFKRRILANIEFKLPDENGRKRIWETHIPKSMPISDDVSIDILSKRFSNISGADIKDIVLFAATKSLRDGREVVNIQDFEYGNNVVIKRYENQKLNDDVKIKTERITEEQYLEEIKASNSKS